MDQFLRFRSAHPQPREQLAENLAGSHLAFPDKQRVCIEPKGPDLFFFDILSRILMATGTSHKRNGQYQ